MSGLSWSISLHKISQLGHSDGGRIGVYSTDSQDCGGRTSFYNRLVKIEDESGKAHVSGSVKSASELGHSFQWTKDHW